MADQINFFEANRQIWAQRTRIHLESKFYDVEGFIGGKESLTSIELSEMGDVKGKNLLHLQCHFGMDTLSWARHGAVPVGIDFSEEAIAEAKKLTQATGLNAEFICCNVYDASKFLRNRQFDIVFTSYGVIGWLPDLYKWASIIRKHLKPGGYFYMAEFHPVVWMFDDQFSKIEYAYHNTGVIETEAGSTYTEDNPAILGKEYGWNHGLSEVFTALLEQGLRVELFKEYSYSPYRCFKNMVLPAEGKWQIAGLEDKIPMVYSIKARG